MFKQPPYVGHTLEPQPHARQEGIRSRTEPNRTEPNRLILEPAGTGRGNEPKRTGPSHDVSENRRPNRVEK